MPEVINDLEDMTIMEISLVDDPACPGADVILMKRRTDLLEEAVSLLRKKGPSKLLEEAVMLLKRDVGDEPRDNRGRWVHAATQLLRQGGAKLTDQVREGAKFLHGQAKEAAVAVATKTGRAVRSGVTAVRTTKLTGAHAVEGGGVQFEFEHGFSSGGRLETRVQVRPEHVTESATKTKALKVVHEYLASTRGEARKPFTEEGQSSFFRYEHRPGPYYTQGQAQPSLFRGPDSPRDNSQNLPSVVNGKTEAGLPTYQWQGRNPPGQAKHSEAFTHQTVGFIPEGRSDMQEHIIHVNNWVNSNRPKSLDVKAAMTRPSPNEAGGNAFFTQKGDYVPEADRGTQWRFVRQYEENRGRREQREANPARTILSSQLSSNDRTLHLGASESATVSDHFDDRMDREGSNAQWSGHERRLNHMASDVVTGKSSGMELSREEVGHLERSMNRIPVEDQSSAHRDLQHKLANHLDYAKRRVRKLFT